jgi:hypothetical protein
MAVARRLDDPGQHQIPKHLITVEGTVEPQRVVCPAQGLPRMPCPQADNLQRTPADSGRIQAEIKGALALGQSLPGRRFERFHLSRIMSRTQMLNTARTAP